MGSRRSRGRKKKESWWTDQSNQIHKLSILLNHWKHSMPRAGSVTRKRNDRRHSSPSSRDARTRSILPTIRNSCKTSSSKRAQGNDIPWKKSSNVYEAMGLNTVIYERLYTKDTYYLCFGTRNNRSNVTEKDEKTIRSRSNGKWSSGRCHHLWKNTNKAILLLNSLKHFNHLTALWFRILCSCAGLRTCRYHYYITVFRIKKNFRYNNYWNI